jgi:hypothetical protein
MVRNFHSTKLSRALDLSSNQGTAHGSPKGLIREVLWRSLSSASVPGPSLSGLCAERFVQLLVLMDPGVFYSHGEVTMLRIIRSLLFTGTIHCETLVHSLRGTSTANRLLQPSVAEPYNPFRWSDLAPGLSNWASVIVLLCTTVNKYSTSLVQLHG